MSNPKKNDNFDPTDLLTIDQEHHLVMGEAWLRLQENPDFKLVILKGYLEQKVLATVSLLGVPQEHHRRPELCEDLISCSNLQFFFSMIENFYKGAKNPVLSDEEEEELAAMAEVEEAGKH
jgi:hypothetical protein